MEFSTLLLIVAFVACPLAMGAMMWMMNRQMNERSGHTASDRTSSAARLEALRKRGESLRAEIQELEGVAELEARTKSLATGSTAESMPGGNASRERSG